MGLFVSVGCLGWKSEDVDQLELDINRVLSSHGLPIHREPSQLFEVVSRSEHLSHSVGKLHSLRSIYAHLAQNHPLAPIEAQLGFDPDNCTAFTTEHGKSSHLVWHSDADGFYVPIDFSSPLHDERLEGQWLGSSVALMRELRSIAPSIGAVLSDDGHLTDAEANRLNSINYSEPWGRELSMWFALFEASRLSIKHKTLICFS